MKISLQIIGVLLVAGVFMGCSTVSSNYPVQRDTGEEILWAVQGGELEVTKNGRYVGGEGDWSGLDSAVDCVPSARVTASNADGYETLGDTLAVLGGVGMVGGTTYAGYEIFRNEDANPKVVGTVVLSSLVFGTAALIVGEYMNRLGEHRAIDAVNMYNDNYADHAECSPPLQRW